MNSRFTVRQIAEALGVDLSTAKRRADRERWPYEETTGRGGRRRLYLLERLPGRVQAALLLRYGDPAPKAPTEEGSAGSRYHYDPEELARWAESRPERLREEGKRRAELLHRVMHLVEHGTPFRRAAELVAQHADCSAASLRNWYYGVNGQPGARDYRRCDWWMALIPRYQGRQTGAACSPEAWDYWLADYLRPERPSAAACYRRLQRVAAERGWTIPSRKTLERRLEREIPRPAIVLAREGREALERMYPAQIRDHRHYRALEALTADGHVLDVLARWPDGRTGRPVLVAWQDIYSGMILGWRISETESGDAYRLSLYDVLRRYGIPRHVYVDNGRGIAGKMLTGGAATRYRYRVRAEDPVGLLTQLVGPSGIHWTTPYHGQAKPIERAFRDLAENIAKHPALAGAYTGPSPAAKPANYGSRAVPVEELIGVVDAEIRAHNTRPGRRSAVCAGRSLEQTFRESYERHRHEIERPTEAQLRQWLLAAEGVTADKTTGAVTLAGNRYWSEALSQLAGLPLERRRVIVRYDPDDLHAGVHVYAMDGREIGHAECVHAAGFGDTEAARRHTRARRQWARAQRAALDAERRMGVDEVAARLREVDERTTPTPPQPEDTVVRRGAFRRRRQVVGSDLAEPDREEDFRRAVAQLIQLRRDEM